MIQLKASGIVYALGISVFCIGVALVAGVALGLLVSGVLLVGTSFLMAGNGV